MRTGSRAEEVTPMPDRSIERTARATWRKVSDVVTGIAEDFLAALGPNRRPIPVPVAAQGARRRRETRLTRP